jgi:predicted nucleic acid-binding protein
LSLKFLLDTNVVSEMTKASPNLGVEERMRVHDLSCAICAPTIEELAFGIARLPASRKSDLLKWWLDGVVARFTLLPYDPRCALWLGRERARLTGNGRIAPRADGEIASVAVVNDLVLVTRNTADFQNFTDLKMENWFKG